jgi:hypothetical protein
MVPPPGETTAYHPAPRTTPGWGPGWRSPCSSCRCSASSRWHPPSNARPHGADPRDRRHRRLRVRDARVRGGDPRARRHRRQLLHVPDHTLRGLAAAPAGPGHPGRAAGPSGVDPVRSGARQRSGARHERPKEVVYKVGGRRGRYCVAYDGFDIQHGEVTLLVNWRRVASLPAGAPVDGAPTPRSPFRRSCSTATAATTSRSSHVVRPARGRRGAFLPCGWFGPVR